VSERKGKRYTEQEREELLGLFGRSGQSASRFCKETGLSYPTGQPKGVKLQIIKK